MKYEHQLDYNIFRGIKSNTFQILLYTRVAGVLCIALKAMEVLSKLIISHKNN